MKRLLFTAVFFIIIIPNYSQQTQLNDTTFVEFNLQKIVKSKLKVTLYPPTIANNEIHFIIPRIIPGTYTQST